MKNYIRVVIIKFVNAETHNLSLMLQSIENEANARQNPNESHSQSDSQNFYPSLLILTIFNLRSNQYRNNSEAVKT